MCTGRIDLSFVLRAFANGVDGVFVGGCWLGECHYLTEGNHHAIVVMLLAKRLLAHIGIDPERLRLEWVSAAQGARFVDVVTDFSEKLKDLGPLGKSEGIDEAVMKLRMEAVRSLIPYIRLVERERLRVRFNTREEYEAFFNGPEVDRIFESTVVERLTLKQILMILAEGPLSIGEIADRLAMRPSEVSKYLSISARERLTRFDQAQKRFALVQDGVAVAGAKAG